MTFMNEICTYILVIIFNKTIKCTTVSTEKYFSLIVLLIPIVLEKNNYQQIHRLCINTLVHIVNVFFI
jgi:hypothetical protein